MNRVRAYAPVLALTIVGAMGCNDFLTGGELTTDPNRPSPSAVTSQQLFVGTQSNLWSELNSDPARIAAMWTQQLEGTNAQYTNIYNYGVSEATTNGFHQALYLGGGLVDIRDLESRAKEAGDSLFLAMGQITESALIGTGADLFGDIVFSTALTGPTPAPDKQMDIYDAIQQKLDSAIAELAPQVAGQGGPTNVGPGGSDLVFQGDPAKWTKLAYTLKARYFLHTAELRGNAAYAAALDAASKGMTTVSDNYNAVFSGLPQQQNHWYQFAVVNRPGYLSPNAFFVGLLESKSDPRLALYFNDDQSDISGTLLAPNHTQPLITAYENLLIWAEAAFRTGNEPLALQKLNEERALWAEQGIVLPPVSASGTALLTAILDEKYIALFQNFEVFNDYKRTCWPNLTPAVANAKIPARLFYDTAERQTDTSLLPPDQQPIRNQNDPATPTDPTGAVCKGQ